jgi:hypothetical protein
MDFEEVEFEGISSTVPELRKSYNWDEIDPEELMCESSEEPQQLKSFCSNIIDEENHRGFRQTPQTVKTSVRMWGPSLQYVRPDLITYKLCKLAILSHDGAIEYVPRDKFTEEEYHTLCLLAVSDNGFTLKEIPKDAINREIVEAAHRHTCCAIMFTPREFLTEELCWKAIARNGEMMEYVPADLATEEMRKAAAEYTIKQKKEQDERASAMTEQLIRDGELRCPIQ